MTQASILLVEDEALIRMMLVEMVEELGHRVIAEAGNVDDGRSLAEIEEYDLAILDINLHGTNVVPVAEAVRGRGLPFFFLSGYGSKGVPDGFEGTPVLAQTMYAGYAQAHNRCCPTGRKAWKSARQASRSIVNLLRLRTACRPSCTGHEVWHVTSCRPRSELLRGPTAKRRDLSRGVARRRQFNRR